MTDAPRDKPDARSQDEAFLRRIVDSMPHMVWTATSDGVCDFLGKRWVEYTGIPEASQLGVGWIEQVHPDDRAHMIAVWQDAVAKGQDVHVNFRIRRSDGAYRWFDTRAIPLRNADGSIFKWLGTNTDLHETLEARAALALNEERLRYVTLATHDAVYDWDMRGGNTFRNDEFQKTFGAPPNIRSDQRWWEQHIHPDDRARVVASADAAFGARQPKWSEQYRLMRTDGTYATVADRAYLIYDEQQQPLRMIGAIADITDYNRVEQSLRDTQASLLLAIEGAAMATWIFDARADRLIWDDAAYRLWGIAPEEMGHLTLESAIARIHADDRTAVQDSVAEFYRTGVDPMVEFRTIRPDGKLQWLQIRGRVERDAAGDPIRVAGVYLDITERKRFEQSLRDSQDRLLSAMEAGGLATWIWDIPSDTVSWDEAASRLWGRRPGEIRALRPAELRDMMHPDDRERVARAHEQFDRTGVDIPVEFRTIRPDGALQWLLAKGQVQRDAMGQPMRMTGVYVDITDRKRSEEAQLRSQKMEALGTLAGGIAHDFNNILLAISGNAKLASEDIAADRVDARTLKQSLQEITKASERAADLVKRILTFSRNQDVQRQVVQLRKVVDESLLLLRPTVPSSIEFHIETLAPDVAVEIDTIQMQQVLMNLITNAAHAIGAKRGSVTITIDSIAMESGPAEELELTAGHYACLSVRDTGSGMDSDVLGRIFDPFFTTKQAGQGTGLGLAVVHGIVKSNGGAITVTSSPGQGAEFRICLPATTASESTRPERSKAPAAVAGEHILYVDDEEALVFLVSRALERLGYRVTGCVDPERALDQLKRNPQDFDVLVTDLSMRGMNGFELARAATAIRSNLPAILTSGYLRAEDRDRATQEGIRELILKPNTVDELGAALDRVLSQMRAETRNAMASGR